MRRTRTRVRPLQVVGAVAALAVLLAGCGEGSNMVDPHGTEAAQIAGLWWVIFWMAVGVFIVVEALIVYAAIRFRVRPNGPLPNQVQGNTPLEITWTIIPTLVLAGVAVATLTTMKAVASPVPDALNITVVGHQWWWEFDYPDQHVVTATELHVPVGQPVTLHVESADVVHNFWAPELVRKVQAIPGHDNVIPMTATSVGTYHGFCAEFCGTEHALMRFEVVVQSPSDFDTWVKDQQAPPPTPTTAQQQAGQKDFASLGCASCHTVGSNQAPGMTSTSGAPIIGPNLTHMASRQVIVGGVLQNDPTGLGRWLSDPEAVKAGNYMSEFIGPGHVQLTPQQVQELTAYLLSLK